MQQLGEREDLEALVGRATELAIAWGSGAAASTTIGQERAILRLFGVSGVDRAGRPLAAEVVDRYLGPDPRRLGGGIALPFAMALAEYDLAPQELALAVAAGNVDLGLEAELLAESDRRAIATADAAALSRAAMDRMDANRTARRELLAVLGDPARPWVGTGLGSAAIVDALDEARAAIDAGAELVRVDVPPSRELAERTARLGNPVERWRAQPSSRGGLDTFDPSGQPIPTGAQRALAVLRRFVDEAGARRRGYVRIMTDAPALAAPDQAVVAAFERIDVVIADPMREIVSGRVDPDRAIADHVFAHRLLARAGTQVLVPAGPLIVANDLASGVPSDPATRAGRALALQLLAVALARRDGLGVDSVVVGAFPDWLIEESGAPARVAAEIALRRALLPGHPIAFVEPAAPAGPRPAVARDRRGAARRRGRRAGGRPPSRRDRHRDRLHAGHHRRRRRPARVARRARAPGPGARPRDPGRRGGDGDAAGARGRRLDQPRGRTARVRRGSPRRRGRRRAQRGLRPARRRPDGRVAPQRRVRPSGSASSTIRPHVGQCHRASSGVPHTAWRSGSPGPPRLTPQSASRWSAPASSRPSALSAYSIRTGLRE